MEWRWEPSVGMVGSSLRVDGEELLGQRGGLEKYARTGSTFGVPLLHPWANRLDRDLADSAYVRRDPNGLPIHGLLNGWPRWEVVAEEPKLLVAQFDFGAHDALLEVFPYPHVVEVEVREDTADRALAVTTRVRPTGDVPVPIAFGWHPYVTIPGTPREEWDVTLPVRSRLVADDRQLPTGAVEDVEYAQPLRLGDREFDDGYAGVDAGARFAVSGAGRTVEVEFTSGYSHAQVYAPAGEQLICFEPMTAPTNALESGDGLRSVDPGDSFEAVFRIRVPRRPE
ncbi:MAG: aldose 1-epimerase [Thermoleophilales bacterium]|nr:aldose 1-epimerase [Thermoleophilales bacterium]